MVLLNVRWLSEFRIVGVKHLRHAGAMHLVKSVDGYIGWPSKRIYENKIFLIEKSHSSSKWCSSQFSTYTSLGMFLLIWSYSGQWSDGGGFSWDMYRLLHWSSSLFWWMIWITAIWALLIWHTWPKQTLGFLGAIYFFYWQMYWLILPFFAGNKLIFRFFYLFDGMTSLIGCLYFNVMTLLLFRARLFSFYYVWIEHMNSLLMSFNQRMIKEVHMNDRKPWHLSILNY